MAAKSPTRLEIHRLKYQQGGKLGVLLTIADLDPDERELLAHDVRTTIQQEAGRTDQYNVYAGVLAEWGVMCPHPQPKRLYEGEHRSELPTDRFGWFDCECCGAYVSNDVIPRRLVALGG